MNMFSYLELYTYFKICINFIKYFEISFMSAWSISFAICYKFDDSTKFISLIRKLSSQFSYFEVGRK